MYRVKPLKSNVKLGGLIPVNMRKKLDICGSGRYPQPTERVGEVSCLHMPVVRVHLLVMHQIFKAINAGELCFCDQCIAKNIIQSMLGLLTKPGNTSV